MIDESLYTRHSGAIDRTAAGGVVVRLDEAGRLLVALAREGRFNAGVLPKGGVDPGETIEQAARREIEEETGIGDLTLLGELGTRQRMSFNRRKWVTTHYFLYITTQIDGTPLDIDRHPQGPIWAALDDLPPIVWREQRELLETSRAHIVRAVASHDPPLKG